MKELQSFIKIETVLCQWQVPSLFWETSDGQQDNTSWSSEDVQLPVGWDQILAAVFPWHGSGVWIIQSSFNQGMDPGGPRPWSIAFWPPSCRETQLQNVTKAWNCDSIPYFLIFSAIFGQSLTAWSSNRWTARSRDRSVSLHQSRPSEKTGRATRQAITC